MAVRGCFSFALLCSYRIDSIISLVVLGRFHNKRLVDVGNNSTAGDSSLDKGIKFFVTANSKLQVTGSNALDPEIPAGVACKLKNLSCEVLKDSGRVDRRCCADAAARIDAALKESVNSSNRELDEKVRSQLCLNGKCIAVTCTYLEASSG
jgi:hypothetical protein